MLIDENAYRNGKTHIMDKNGNTILVDRPSDDEIEAHNIKLLEDCVNKEVLQYLWSNLEIHATRDEMITYEQRLRYFGDNSFNAYDTWMLKVRDKLRNRNNNEKLNIQRIEASITPDEVENVWEDIQHKYESVTEKENIARIEKLFLLGDYRYSYEDNPRLTELANQVLLYEDADELDNFVKTMSIKDFDKLHDLIIGTLLTLRGEEDVTREFVAKRRGGNMAH